MPKVEVTGVGVLSFPVPPAQIASLTSQASRAPYGRGEETILDESVRKVWQLQPGKVRITGKSWAASFDTILRQVIVGLGCEGLAVSAEFYKMLVYEEGGFFLTHRDTEKAGGMFGTLVVVLPSAHRGGELVIRHAGREVVVDMSRAEVSEASFAAFYADCEHEVRAITEGSRVCLIYNLIQDRTRVEARPHRTKNLAPPARQAVADGGGRSIRAQCAGLRETNRGRGGIAGKKSFRLPCGAESRMAVGASIQPGWIIICRTEVGGCGAGEGAGASGGTRGMCGASGDRAYRRVRGGGGIL